MKLTRPLCVSQSRVHSERPPDHTQLGREWGKSRDKESKKIGPGGSKGQVEAGVRCGVEKG